MVSWKLTRGDIWQMVLAPGNAETDLSRKCTGIWGPEAAKNVPRNERSGCRTCSSFEEKLEILILVISLKLIRFCKLLWNWKRGFLIKSYQVRYLQFGNGTAPGAKPPTGHRRWQTLGSARERGSRFNFVIYESSVLFVIMQEVAITARLGVGRVF